MAREQSKDVEAKLPRHIILDEPIGWMEHGVLRQFHEGQQVTLAADIRDLIAHGAKYMELK